MSFSKQVTREIIAAELPQKCCARAAAYAAACFSASYGPGGLCLTTEMSAVAQYLKKVFARAGIQGRVYAKGAEQSRMYEFTVAEPQQVKRMLEMFFFNTGSPCLRLKKELFCCEKCVSAFAASAFLCGGTITDPQKEYNLEFLSARHLMLDDFSALLTARGFVPRTILRKGSGVLYFKASEQIEDMLTFMGAQSAALEIMNLKVYKDFRNKANRLTNCETANIGKTASASAQTLYAIQLLRRRGALAALPEALQQAAAVREAYPTEPLKELAAHFPYPISKSGLSHRIKKLEALAAELEEASHDS